MEKNRAELFYRFAKKLPKNWEGKSVRSLLESGFGQKMSEFIGEVLNWMAEEAAGNRPQMPDAPAFSGVTGQAEPNVQVPEDAPMTGILT